MLIAEGPPSFLNYENVLSVSDHDFYEVEFQQ